MVGLAKWAVLGVLAMANVIDSDLHVTGVLQVSSDATTPKLSGGSGAMSSTGKSNGSLHMRTDTDELPEVLHNSAVEKMGLGQHAIEARIVTPLVANSANIYLTYAPRKLKITGVSRAYATVPASAAGTVVAQVEISNDGGSNFVDVLASASENEEGLTNDALTTHTLTGTAANLKADKGAWIRVTVTSDNVDMTAGTVGQYHIYYEDN